GGDAFSSILGNAIDEANGVQQNATNLDLAGATGQASVADVTVAATEAQLSVELITAVRDKAVDAFNSIMSMTT
ncbi:MAG TPA: flagellar hook-basal body complex protein FliE, partial [Acidimicrobiales bacterium]|nr:flagellar hook-basal body complex protein FliE [Acidimicrobiales bacterium]